MRHRRVTQLGLLIHNDGEEEKLNTLNTDETVKIKNRKPKTHTKTRAD